MEMPMPSAQEPVPEIEDDDECRYTKLDKDEIKDMKKDCLKSVLEALTASDISEELLCCREEERGQIERIIFKHLLYDKNR